jgi:alkanesulfonate monooxygenase SsuD/methylene tetrahydromethanopterin reductase-like flavin-dependent oxidoreductase (luciferase family)
VRQVRLAESLGFDSFFLPESHLHAGARPSPLVTLAALAGATGRIRLGTTSLLLPLRHPLLLAEEIATLDRLSGGRLILGLGRGFRPGTFEAFGIDPRTKRERFEEVLATVLRAWGVDPWWPGAPAPPARAVPLVEPRPLQQPHPPLWIAAFGPRAIDQAARLGLPYLASPVEPIEVVEANLERHRRACSAPRGEARVVAAMRTVDMTDGPAAGLEAIREATTRLRLTHLVVHPTGVQPGDDPDRAVRALADKILPYAHAGVSRAGG